MRCPTCGTENTADSRFCGGCGAKLVPAEPRVAPTAKIPDDAPFPYAPPPQSFAPSPSFNTPAPVSYAPPSMPPTQMPSAPNDARMPSAPKRVAQASISIAAPKRRTGLIATVIVLDLALAAAGAVLLFEGLQKPEPKVTPATKASAPAPAPTSAPTPAPTPAPTVTPLPPAPAKTAVAPAPDPAPNPAIGSAIAAIAAEPAPKPVAAPAPKPVAASASRPPSKQPAQAKQAPAAPQDPYDPAHALVNEVDLQIQRSRGAIDDCAARYAAHGGIKLAFDVEPDGRISHLKGEQNTTGSGMFASCVVQAAETWSFATHPARTTAFVRSFSYP